MLRKCHLCKSIKGILLSILIGLLYMYIYIYIHRIYMDIVNCINVNKYTSYNYGIILQYIYYLVIYHVTKMSGTFLINCY